MKNKKFVFSIVSIIVLNISAVLFCFYLYSYIQNQLESKDKIINDLFSLEKKTQKIKLLALQIEELKNKSEKIDSIFLKKEEIVNFIERLEATAKESGVSIEIISADTDDKDKDKVSFRFALGGGFMQTMQYIVLLENFPYQIVFKNLTMSKKSVTKSNVVWQSNFEINLVSFLDNKND